MFCFLFRRCEFCFEFDDTCATFVVRVAVVVSGDYFSHFEYEVVFLLFCDYGVDIVFAVDSRELVADFLDERADAVMRFLILGVGFVSHSLR